MGNGLRQSKRLFSTFRKTTVTSHLVLVLRIGGFQFTFTTNKAMKERPILFSGPMVRAILEGRKTQTRRLVKPAIVAELEGGWGTYNQVCEMRDGGIVPCPYGVPGDRLWVRETFTQTQFGNYVYRADAKDDKGQRWHSIEVGDPSGEVKWRPSIFMPRAASRILLEITDVRVERLQSITEIDAKSEGAKVGYFDIEGKFVSADEDTEIKLGRCGCFLSGFENIWININGPESWEKNPWVWVIEFKKVQS